MAEIATVYQGGLWSRRLCESHVERVASHSLGTRVPAKWACLVDAGRGLEERYPSGVFPSR